MNSKLSLCAQLIVSVVAVLGAAEAEATPVFDIPRLEQIVIDGKPDDWGGKGFRVDILTADKGRSLPAANFNPAFRLGWDERGVLALVTVTDDVALEAVKKADQKKADLWRGDSIEFFVGTQRGGNFTYQVVISPGRDPNSPEIRDNLSDYRKGEGKKEKLAIERARMTTESGYVLEVLLPWKNLGIEPQEGRELALQFYANEADKEEVRYQALWYPKGDTYSDTNNMHRIRLAANPSPAVRALASASVDAEGRGEVSVLAVEELKGKKIQVKDGEKTVGKGKLEASEGRAAAKIQLNKPKDKPYGDLTVMVEDEVVATVKVPEAK